MTDRTLSDGYEIPVKISIDTEGAVSSFQRLTQELKELTAAAKDCVEALQAVNGVMAVDIECIEMDEDDLDLDDLDEFLERHGEVIKEVLN